MRTGLHAHSSGGRDPRVTVSRWTGEPAWSLQTGGYYSAVKEGLWHTLQHGRAPRTYAEGSSPVTEGHIVCDSTHGQIHTETQSRRVGTRAGRGGWGVGSASLISSRLSTGPGPPPHEAVGRYHGVPCPGDPFPAALRILGCRHEASLFSLPLLTVRPPGGGGGGRPSSAGTHPPTRGPGLRPATTRV